MIILIAILSLALNALVLSLDTGPYISSKVSQKYLSPSLIEVEGELDDEEQLITTTSVQILKNQEPISVWSERNGFTEQLIALKDLGDTEFQLNNYPRSFLYFGIIKYSIQTKDLILLRKAKDLFDLEIENNKSIKRIDQVPLGLSALMLYEIYPEKKYLNFSGKVFKYIISNIEEDGLISYRKGQTSVLNDTLGLTVPFLIEFDKYTYKDTIEIVKNQLDYFNRFGVNANSYLPTHSINREFNVATGSSNWGRGIGWYYLALSYYYHHTGEMEEQYEGLTNTLLKLRNDEGVWTQFPGSSAKTDMSTTTLFIYGMLLNQPTFTKSEVFSLLSPHIDKEGYILETSGDTYGINNYSQSFGKSELSQGVLLLILSTY